MSNLHALIVEDDQQSASVIERMLALQGISSTVVYSAAGVDDVLASRLEVHIVFVDLALPIVNGYGVLEKIRRESRFDNVPVVACTVYSDEINNAHQSGFHSFIAKPLRMDTFHDQVKRILANEHIWDRGG